MGLREFNIAIILTFLEVLLLSGVQHVGLIVGQFLLVLPG
jgi:hypothetical protein